MRWLTKQEVQKLKDIWATASKQEIMEAFPDRKFASLAIRARKLGLKSLRHKNSKGDILPLLNESFEAYYWLGFILADGYFSAQNALSVRLSGKDENHLRKLADFLKTEIKYPLDKNYGKMFELKTRTVSISVGDSKLVPKIREIFSLHSTNKSCNPPILPEMSGDKFMSFLAGYIDGDGCIAKQGDYGKYKRTDVVIQVKCHSSWFEILCEMEKRLYKELNFEFERNHVRINKQGYTFWKLSNNKVIRKFKSELLRLDVPLMERKWDKIKM